MKNYIRTKDGSFIDYRIVVEKNIPHLFVENGKFIDFNSGGRYEILKQADTIEELCDEFVAMCDEYKKPFAWSNHHKDYFKEVKQFYDFWGKKNNKHLQFLYGAIWTDKGLIYVAKMNEKGELELL